MLILSIMKTCSFGVYGLTKMGRKIIKTYLRSFLIKNTHVGFIGIMTMD